MSHFSTEDNNLAQQMEGFNCNYNANEGLYELTPEEAEVEASELDEQIYNEQPEEEEVPMLDVQEPMTLDDMVAAVSQPEPTKAKTSSMNPMSYWTSASLTARVLFILALVIVVVYALYYFKLISMPKGMPSVSNITNMFDGATSSFGSSSTNNSLGNALGRASAPATMRFA